MRKNLILLTFICFGANIFAQLHEVGATIGGSNYSGDIGSSTLVIPNAPAFGLIYKYNRNPRISYRASFTAMKIKANNADKC